MKKSLSSAAKGALRSLLSGPSGSEIAAFLNDPPVTVFDPKAVERTWTCEDVALRGSFADGYRRVLRDITDALDEKDMSKPKPSQPSSIS